ncbi:probable WRKY transcription factor 20 [Actinidia eriantha]|uniref:probable WRKY transcription factor 20 n=1 Tax=Actinidia eriantha TaxID=165200 RepID=UPI002583D2B3|nr:probable WRKY transcription factor 20 [Actinidia eriantha]XP_057461401.1 probable WRKY transcription factor 20 [Actinidia eriantha]XP_057461402.1 probable WRKY transcription factor 20 [Actinidia eriantha]
MVTLGEVVQDAVASDKSQHRESPDHESQSNQEGSTLSVLADEGSGELHKTQSANSKVSASKCNEEGNTLSMITEEVSDNVQVRQGSDITSREQTAQSDENSPSVIPIRESHNLLQSQSPSSIIGDHSSEANQEGTSFSKIPAQDSDNLQERHGSDTVLHASESVKKESSHSAIPEKVPDILQLTQTPNTGSHLLHRDQEGKNSSRTPDKASEDGYNWRKYGQKLVKGNEFTRSYYRCTHPNCPAKRQVERLLDGQITDTIYLGKHEHPKPQPSPQISVSFVRPIQAIRPEETSLDTGQGKACNAHGLTSHHAKPVESPKLSTIAPNDDAVEGASSLSNRTNDEVDHSADPDSKRQKKDINNISEIAVEKPNGDPRVVVQTTSEVDIVNDGYRWRKYGQKLVKGNPNPRSYYRCSNAGCPVKKHVERASHDLKVVITTYEGQHDHDKPPARTVTHNAAGADSSTAHNSESRSRPEESRALGLEMVVHTSAN